MTVPKQYGFAEREARRVLNLALAEGDISPRLIVQWLDLLDGHLADVVEPHIVLYLRTNGNDGVQRLQLLNSDCGEKLLSSSRFGIVSAMLDIVELHPDTGFRPALSTVRKRWNYFGQWAALKKRAATLERVLSAHTSAHRSDDTG